MVSPLLKGGGSVAVAPFGTTALYSGASADGNRMVFSSTDAAVGDAERGMQYYASAVRTANGWKTRNALPATPDVPLSWYGNMPSGAWLSDDATAMLFVSAGTWVTGGPAYDGGLNTSVGLYLSRTGDVSQWLTRPLDATAWPQRGESTGDNQMLPAGGSADLRTAYFSYCGGLSAADGSRAGRLNLGFYVARDGVVAPAGALPDGTIDPDGAAAANGALKCSVQQQQFSHLSSAYGNQVSRDGSHAFFVSPDPKNQTARPTQLYVHREGKASLLASRALGGDTPTPGGIVPMDAGQKPKYVVASPNGEHVVFLSKDRLTTDAPSGSAVGLFYRFDVETQALTYLPDVRGRVDGVSDDGQRIMYSFFSYPETFELGFYDRGVTKILGSGTGAGTSGRSAGTVSPRMTEDGKTWVFTYSHPLGDSPTHVDGTNQVYRYVVGDSDPECLSCVPAGSPASTGARLDPWEEPLPNPAGQHYLTQRDALGTVPIRPARNVSADGRRVFFDTKDALLPQDTNGMIDVYAWEDGVVSLISAGTGPRDSFLLDSSASGDDVFFATADELVAGDTDMSFDVYDKRVGGGFSDAEGAQTCQADECQRPPSPLPVLLDPGSGPAGTTDNLVPPGPIKGKQEKARVLSTRGTRGTRGRAVLRVRVPAAGRITASGSGFGSVSRKVKRAATYTVTVKPSTATKRLLQKTGKRRSRIRVRFVPSGNGRATTITVALTVRK